MTSFTKEMNPQDTLNELVQSSVVGDGGVSWRLKALNRAKEQAARQGRHLKQDTKPEYLKDISVRHPEMKPPRARDSLSWGRKKDPNMHNKDAALISSAISSINKFANDANFMSQVMMDQNEVECSPKGVVKCEEVQKKECSSTVQKSSEHKQPLSANQIAAKAMQLRLKGKHDEAQTMSTRADDEYEYDGAPSKKSKRKVSERENKSAGKRIVTQQERCLFCFENPQRPKHLVVAIANFTYLMLPQFTPVAPGHCCIVTLQHELATRMVDDNVWEEIRNFKKCLIMMFGKQGKEVIFLETVFWLSQQRRHCLIECIPLPQDIAKDGPLYFKKAIDEAESEWSQTQREKTNRYEPEGIACLDS